MHTMPLKYASSDLYHHPDFADVTLSLTLLNNPLLLHYLCEHIQITLQHHQQSFLSSQRFKVESSKTMLLSISPPPGNFETNLTEYSGIKPMYLVSQCRGKSCSSLQAPEGKGTLPCNLKSFYQQPKLEMPEELPPVSWMLLLL